MRPIQGGRADVASALMKWRRGMSSSLSVWPSAWRKQSRRKYAFSYYAREGSQEL